MYYKLFEMSHQLMHARSLAYVLKHSNVLSCFSCWSY